MAGFVSLALNVSVDQTAGQFSLDALDISASDKTLKGCLDKWADAFGHTHAELQDVPDNDLTDQGKGVRDTPVSFP
jgi:hypothetical protein